MNRRWAIWICPDHPHLPVGQRLDESQPHCSECVPGKESGPMERVTVEEVPRD